MKEELVETFNLLLDCTDKSDLIWCLIHGICLILAWYFGMENLWRNQMQQHELSKIRRSSSLTAIILWMSLLSSPFDI